MGIEKDITIRIPGQSRNTLRGKLLFIVLLALVFGYLMAKGERRKHEQVVHGSEAEVAAFLQEYEAECREQPLSVANHSVACLFIFGFLYAIYEVGGRLLGAGVGAVLDRVQARSERGFDEGNHLKRQE